MSIVEAEHPAGVPVSVSVEIGGKEISFETGKLAKQADGAVVVRSGDTVVMGTAQGRTEAREGADFFPLTVDVEERMYAAGKIPGGFFKREGRPTERAILTARMTDRPVRPLWPKGYRNETQCVATVFSADMVTAHDILCINAVSAALVVSPLPFLGPIGAVRMGIIEGELVVNPTLQETAESELDLIVVGTKDGLTMVEAGAKQVPEAKLLEALEIAHREIVKICQAQEDLRAKVGKAKWLDPSTTERLEAEFGHQIWTRIQEVGLRDAAGIVEEIVEKEAGTLSMDSTHEQVFKELQTRMSLAQILEKQRSVAVEVPVREQFENDLRGLTEAEQDSKDLKSAKRNLLFTRIVETASLSFPVGDGDSGEKDSLTKSYIKKACEAIYKSLVRQKIAVDKRRPDGRSAAQIRPIEIQVGVLPRTHGSGLFTRGQTQILTLLTLGTAKEGQRIDDLSRAGSSLHAPLQLPAVLRRGDGPDGLAEAARHRSRRSRAAGPRSGHPAGRGLPVHDPPRLGDARVERLLVDGLGLRLDARPDGRGRSDHGAGLRHRDGPRQGGRRLRHPHGHPGCRGSPR